MCHGDVDIFLEVVEANRLICLFFLLLRFDGAGYSIAQTKEVLASIASDCLVDDGYCVNAVEVLWTPGEKDEVLTKNDMILDFPELIDI